ncbi:calpain-type cysteine protease DEK1-like [Castanea sativa]|uniref:calpain-type cysteine protease DEK1-like n=1 Tax=Castanea sativa TaxID=21020 RepID=UPI003F652341
MDFQLQSMIEFHAKHHVNQHLLPVGRKMRSEFQTGGGFTWCWESVYFRRALFLQRHCAMALNMNGPWSDSSPEWTDRMKHKLKHSKDGIFLMSWQDFQIHFRSIYVCRVYPPEMRYYVYGQWRCYSAGGCQDYDTWHQNPQLRFHDSMMCYIGMRILKTHGCRAAHNIYLRESVGGTDYVNSREISCEMVLDLDPRGYTIVPTTMHPGEEAPFVLSVFTKASISLEAL